MSPLRFGERTLIVLGFGAALLIVVAMGVLATLRLRSALDAGDWYAHTWEVLEQANAVGSDIIEAGTGERGFLLTGESKYLESYSTALRAIPADLGRLRELTADNPRQQERIARLSKLIDAKLAALKETIELRAKVGFAAALDVFETDRAKRLGDEARGLLLEIEAEENALLKERLAARDGERQVTYVLLAAGSVIACLLVAVAAVALLRNVRRLGRSERSLRESQQRLSVTLNSIGDGVIATNTAGLVTFMNPVAVQMTGWDAKEGRGRPLVEVFNIVNEETRSTVENPVEKVMRTGYVVGLANHTILVRRDGSEVPIDDSAAPIRDGGGEIMGVVLVFRDVSERKEVEATRRRYELAEAANQAKDQFLAMLSHELRSPLNAMLGWVRLLQRGGAKDEIFDRAIEVLDRNIAMQTKLVNELLDMSRVISGKLKLEFGSVDLSLLARECIDSIRPAAESKDIALSLEDDATQTLTVRGDSDRLQQVVCNLLENAVKFTPSGGHIALALRRNDDRAEIHVQDDGEGIPESFLLHVFERFRQADPSLSRTRGGLGLGLAIVQHLVERHGGRVSAESDGPGTGSTFTVSLPLVSEPDIVSALPIAHTSTALTARTILLVEDDPDTLEALRIALSRSGACVFAASNITEALALFDEHHPTLIVSDISMPGGDGYQLIRAIRRREKQHTRAVAMTGLASKDDRSAALDAGFDDYFAKPIDPEKLIAFVG